MGIFPIFCLLELGHTTYILNKLIENKRKKEEEEEKEGGEEEEEDAQ